eukprot:1372943-Lingulodinium_polyedra.AAC.1
MFWNASSLNSLFMLASLFDSTKAHDDVPERKMARKDFEDWYDEQYEKAGAKFANIDLETSIQGQFLCGAIGCYHFSSSQDNECIDEIVHSSSGQKVKLPAQCMNIKQMDCGTTIQINNNWSSTEACLSHTIEGDVMSVKLATRFNKDCAYV